MNELITPEQAMTRQELTDWAAGEFVLNLAFGDSKKALKDYAELGALVFTEEEELKRRLGLMRFEIIDAALDFGVSFFDALAMPMVGSSNHSCRRVLNAGISSVRPSGLYSKPAIIDGFAVRQFEFSDL